MRFWFWAVLVLLVVFVGAIYLSNKAEDEGNTIKVVFSNWEEGAILSALAAAVIEDAGYEVELVLAGMTPCIYEIASGRADLFFGFWMPGAHQLFDERYGHKFEYLGELYRGGRLGLLVPDYMDITSIEDLNASKDALGGIIYSSSNESAVSIMSVEACERYDLDFDVVCSNSSAVIALMRKSLSENTPIAFSGWVPHGEFSHANIKFLEDPLGVFGGIDAAYAICRKGFIGAHPELARKLQIIDIQQKELDELEAYVKGARDPIAYARAWLIEHPEVRQRWEKKYI